MNITLQHITPQIAAEMLAQNVGNRPLSKHHVNFLSDQIKESAWQVTGDPIKVSTSGRILDGQHRLNAIVQAGVSVDVFVASGVPDEVFTVLDTGKVRTARDVLGIQDLKSPNDQAALARCFLAYQDGRTNVRIRAYTNKEILDFCTQNDVISHVNLAVAYQTKGAPISRTIIAFCSFLLHSVDSERARDYMDRLCLGINITHGSAIYMVREKLNKAIQGRYNLSKWEAIAIIIKAWNLERTGSALPSMIIYNPEREDFPKAI